MLHPDLLYAFPLSRLIRAGVLALLLANTFITTTIAHADDPPPLVPGGWRTFSTANTPIAKGPVNKVFVQDVTRDGRALGHGKGYLYPHETEGHFTPQNYLPDAIKGMSFYRPGDQGYEVRAAERLARWRAAQLRALGVEPKEGPVLTREQEEAMKRGHRPLAT